jgi:hypothetical protein
MFRVASRPRRLDWRTVRICMVLLAASVVCAQGATYLFDFGPPNSAVWPGFTPVTPQHVFTNGAAFGWQAGDTLKAQARAYTNFVGNESLQKEFVEPFEQATFVMPAPEWKQWKQDPEPETGGMPAVSDEDTRRGFVLYSRPYLDCVYPHTKPRAEELNPALKLFACPGEYEPANFIVLPAKTLQHAKVSVSALGPISAAEIDIRHVKFMRARPNYTVRNRWHWVPDVLEHFHELELKAGENARFWLTVHVPANTAAGEYRGKVRS